MDPGFFSPIRISVLKVRIRIRPCINLCDLNDGLDKVLEKPDKKTVLRVLVMKYNIFSTFTLVLGRFFFTDPDFFGLDPDFWPIRTRTRKKI